MIIRIVKLTFKPEFIADFIKIFDESKTLISNFEGCQQVELLNDITNKNIFFTYSYWQDENALNTYRESELFKNVWAKTKILFDDKPNAWSVEKIA
jgi:heme-degrading monooxygenase HmoA